MGALKKGKDCQVGLLGLATVLGHRGRVLFLEKAKSHWQSCAVSHSFDFSFKCKPEHASKGLFYVASKFCASHTTRTKSCCQVTGWYTPAGPGPLLLVDSSSELLGESSHLNNPDGLGTLAVPLLCRQTGQVYVL